MSDKNLVVGVILLAMTLWVFSGNWNNSVVEADDSVQVESRTLDDVTLVRAVRSKAEARTLFLDVRGQTTANRMVQVKAEVAGKVVDLPGEKGNFVNKGDLLCRIAEDARQDEFTQARAELESARLEYNGFVDLNKKGLQSEVVLAKARAALEQSRTKTELARLALSKTTITAPFDGVVTGQLVEVGDYLSPGSVCVTLMEVNPMLVVGQVAEKNIGQVTLQDAVEVQLITGETYQGKVSFISHSPDATTRTYPVEVTIDNPGATIRTGLTAEMRVPVGVEKVHLISSASLVLNDEGTVGVRIADQQSRVRFMPVTIADENPRGIWVHGLPESIDLITVGQEEVSEGQLVNVDYSPLSELVTAR